MRKMGKYEAPAPQKGKSPILQTYFTSLVSLVLCAVMFLGTTFAWFTSDVTSAGNEIYIGILSAGLYHEDVRINDKPDHKVFDANTLWEANYTAVETLTVRNEGELAFNYRLGLSVDEKNSVQVGGAELGKEGIAALAKLFTVWVYPGKWDPQTVTSYDDLIAEGSGWTQVGGETATLADILEKGTEIAAGALDIKDQEAVVSVALHLDKEAGSEIMGQKLSLNVRLIASQKSYESDAFGPGYDAGEKTVNVTAANLDSIDFTQDNATFVLSGEFAEDLTLTLPGDKNQTIDASGATFEGAVLVYAPCKDDGYSFLEDQSREGTLTLSGFETSALNVYAHNLEAVNITGNKVNAMQIVGGNFALNIENNTVNGAMGTYVGADGTAGKNQYGVNLEITDYELSFTGNTVSKTYSHCVGLNGRQAWGSDPDGDGFNDYYPSGENNRIVAFSGNTIKVESTEKTERAAFKIWDDRVYAPYGTSGQEPNDAAKQLMEMILENNTIEIAEGSDHVAFDIYGKQYPLPEETA